jgi:hypothetical protein
MKTSTKAITPLVLTMLLAVGGVSACTPDDDPTPSTTTVPNATQPTASTTIPDTTTSGLTLITNDGTVESPVGHNGDSLHGGINGSGTVALTSGRLRNDGSDGPQAYIWTLEDGLTLVSNAGTDADPVEANGGGRALRINDDGSVVFASASTGLPGNTNKEHNQIYLWSAKDGLTLVSNAGTLENPVGAANIMEPDYVQSVSSAAVAFASAATDLPGSNGLWQVYLWTAKDGVTLISNIGTPEAPVGANVNCYPDGINAAGSVLFHAWVREPTQTGLPGSNDYGQTYLWTPTDGITLVTNVGTKEAPVGANFYSGGVALSDDDAVLFQTTGEDAPGGNGLQQVYRWTPAEGTVLITNVGTADNPVGASGDSFAVAMNSNGSIVFGSRAIDLPGGTGILQAYLWTAKDGITLISNVGTAQAPVGTVQGAQAVQVNNDDSVLFTSYDKDLPGGNGSWQIYLWTAKDGVTLITNIGTTEAPAGSSGETGGTRDPSFNDKGWVVFTSNAVDLPGSNGRDQVYLWTPPA